MDIQTEERRDQAIQISIPVATSAKKFLKPK